MDAYEWKINDSNRAWETSICVFGNEVIEPAHGAHSSIIFAKVASMHGRAESKNVRLQFVKIVNLDAVPKLGKYFCDHYFETAQIWNQVSYSLTDHCQWKLWLNKEYSIAKEFQFQKYPIRFIFHVLHPLLSHLIRKDDGINVPFLPKFLEIYFYNSGISRANSKGSKKQTDNNKTGIKGLCFLEEGTEVKKINKVWRKNK